MKYGASQSNKSWPQETTKPPKEEWENDMKIMIATQGSGMSMNACIEKIKDLLAQTKSTTRRETLEEVMLIIGGWKNDGENPTETGLMLENILSALSNLK